MWIPLIASAQNEPKVRELELMELKNSGSTTGTQTKKVAYYPDIMRHKFALCQHIILPSSRQVSIHVVTALFPLICLELKSSRWREHSVHPDNAIQEQVAIEPFEILLTNFFATVKNSLHWRSLSMLPGVHVIIWPSLALWLPKHASL